MKNYKQALEIILQHDQKHTFLWKLQLSTGLISSTLKISQQKIANTVSKYFMGYKCYTLYNIAVCSCYFTNWHPSTFSLYILC